ncbi:mitochondrial splicing apparatus component-domain-containing protein [Scheffersomyces xylosifermentans]|uniref:mitochondrial splicing apparatus component-domain-containing protein n=1 Tax=Scheffersomyces xylosifermentans TaxID=1304137 RepID=UPI00315CE34D
MSGSGSSGSSGSSSSSSTSGIITPTDANETGRNGSQKSANVDNKGNTFLHRQKLYSSVWKFAELIREADLPVTNTTYVLLLQICTEVQNPPVQLACTLYEEAMNRKATHRSESYSADSNKEIKTKAIQIALPPTEDQKWILSRNLLDVLSKSTDMLDILRLNALWKQYLVSFKGRQSFETKYHSTYIHILLNTNQIEFALEYFERTFRNLSEKNHSLQQIFHEIPSTRLIQTLISYADFDSATKWIKVFINDGNGAEHVAVISNELWLECLNSGLNSNNYPLVKLIYDNFIMRGFNNAAISIEQAIFEDLESKDSGFNYINDQTTFQILHTLAINGDVSSTLNLIESHYLHKSLKGEKALTKELCIKIIESYCYNGNLTNNWTENEPLASSKKDPSVKRILGVLNGIVEKLQTDKDVPLTYSDISAAMSTRFWQYYDHDTNIEKTFRKRLDISEKIMNSEENDVITSVLPRKIANTNIESSQYGNILANLDVLHSFILTHMEFLLSENTFHKNTITLFINCILEHLHVHQNFTSVVRVLQTLYHLNSSFMSQWLNTDSLDIIFNSLSNSSSAKQCSVVLFDYMKSTNQTISHENYKCLISSILRGYIHPSLQFYFYHYLRDFHGTIDPEIISLIDELPEAELRSEEGTAKMIDFIKSIQAGLSLDSTQIDEVWSRLGLCADKNLLGEEKPNNFYRLYHERFDERDSGYLKYILNCK